MHSLMQAMKWSVPSSPPSSPPTLPFPSLLQYMLAPIIDSRFNSYGTTKAKVTNEEETRRKVIFLQIIHVPQSNSSIKFELEGESRMARNLWQSASISDDMEAS